MQDFYKIPEHQLADFTTRTYLGMNSSLKFKIRWSNPNVKTMVGLRGIEDLIPGHIRTHFQTIQDGHVGYFHMELHRGNVGGPRWAWQREVPIRRVSGVLEEIEIKHRGKFFTGDHMLLSQPSLWIFDCKRCSSVGEDTKWSAEDYSKSLFIVQQWMDQIPRWNIIFLLHEANFFDDALQDSIGLPPGTIARTSMWVFDPTTYRQGKAST
jgi:hypothetical protein